MEIQQHLVLEKIIGITTPHIGRIKIAKEKIALQYNQKRNVYFVQQLMLQ